MFNNILIWLSGCIFGGFVGFYAVFHVYKLKLLAMAIKYAETEKKLIEDNLFLAEELNKLKNENNSRG